MKPKVNNFLNKIKMETIFKQNPKKYLSNPRKKDYYNFIHSKLLENEINSVLDIGAVSYIIFQTI